MIDLAAWPDAPPVMDAVQALVDKSLLRTWVPAGDARFDLDELYFGMYVSIHEYAGERLRARGADAERMAEARHGRCFARFGEDAAIEALYGHGGTQRHRALALELDNVVAACRRAVARGDASTAVLTYRAAWEVLDMRGPLQLAAELGAHVLGLDGLDETQRARAILIRARTLQRAGKSGQARELLDQALALALRSGDDRIEANARANLGALLVRQGRMDEGRGHLDAALALYRAQGNRRAEGNVLTHLGRFHIDTGEVDEGRRRYAEALVLQRLQIESLPPVVREKFLRSFDRAAMRSDFIFNDSVLFFDPYFFAARAYAHFKASADGCAYLAALLEGEVSFIAPAM